MQADFPLPIGHQLEQGEVIDRSLTAYKVRRPNGGIVFVPFWGPTGVHELVPATPLVRLTG